MATEGRFVIENKSARVLMLCVEPEGAIFPLAVGECVVVYDPFVGDPATLRFTQGDSGEPFLSVWPGDGDTRVEKGGVNLLDTL